jgi:glutamate formiminotransferase
VVALDTHFDPDHARTVLTLGGTSENLHKSCIELIEWSVSHLDVHSHVGVHPRFGVVDVLPLVPYGDDEAATRARASELGNQITSNFGLPVFTYGRAHTQHRSLPELRRFLRTRAHPAHPTAGVVCLGIRDPLIAFNVNFRGQLSEATAVAGALRSPEIRSLGFKLDSRQLVQISMNLVKPELVGPRRAFERVIELARDTTLELVDCEVVGLVPEPSMPELNKLPLRAPVRSIEQALAEKGIR